MPTRATLAWSAAVVLLSSAYLTFNFRLHKADLTAPLCPPRNDSAALLSLVKNVQESGWPWIVNRLGAPGTAERYDYPLPEHAHYLTIRLLLWLTGDVFSAFNLWGLLSYPLTAACAFGVLRAMRVASPIAFALALVYAFLPYHANRVFSHTMLAHYQTVPLVLLPCFWIIEGRLPFFGGGTTRGTLAIAAVVAATSPYYAFFGCYALAVAGAHRALSVGSWRPLASGLAVAGTVTAFGLACAAPFMAEQRRHGANPAVAQRHPNEADVYALKVTQLVLPWTGHRIGAVAHVSRHYQAEAIHANENRDSAMGLVGVVGFAILIGRLLAARGPTLLGGLSVLNVSLVVLGSSGGLGGLFNFLVYAQIRCYNRLCVVVAFVCLLALGIVVTRWALAGRSWRAWAAGALLLAVGLLDTTSPRQAPEHMKLQEEHREWAAFVATVEDRLPEGGMVFQLPATSYPEFGNTQLMPDYAHLACHPYSRTLRFSYGTDRNRRWGEWHRYVAGLPTKEMIRALCLAGFDAVYVDRRGILFSGDDLLSILRSELGPEIASRESGTQSVFSLRAATAFHRAAVDAPTWERDRERLLNRPCVLLQDGFRRWAPTKPPEPWVRRPMEFPGGDPERREDPRLATHSVRVRLVNPGSESRAVVLRWDWVRQVGDPIEVRTTCRALGIDRVDVPPSPRGPFELAVTLPPGEHVLHLDASPKPLGPAKMHFAWNATNVRLEVVDP